MREVSVLREDPAPAEREEIAVTRRCDGRLSRNNAGQRAAQDAHLWQQAGRMTAQQGRRNSRVDTTEARKRDTLQRDMSLHSPPPRSSFASGLRPGGCQRAPGRTPCVPQAVIACSLFVSFPFYSFFSFLFLSCLRFVSCLFFARRLLSLSSLPSLCVVCFCPSFCCPPTTQRARISGKNQRKTAFSEPRVWPRRTVTVRFFGPFLGLKKICVSSRRGACKMRTVTPHFFRHAFFWV